MCMRKKRTELDALREQAAALHIANNNLRGELTESESRERATAMERLGASPTPPDFPESVS